MATLKDVAKDAGVSIATVSCCLSGNKNVKPETKMKIMDSIEKLKYIPNASARSLKKSVSNSIGIILPNIDEKFHTEIFKGISSYLQRKGYICNVAFSDNIPFIECSIIEDFVSQNVSGLLIMTFMPDNTEFFQNRLINYGIPTVFIERKPHNLDVNFVGFSNQKTMYHLTKELLNHHYRRIAIITGSKSYSSEADSIDGYQLAFNERNLPIDSSLIQETNMSKEDSFKTVLANLDLDTLEAIITTSENSAYGVLEAFHLQNISVPDDIQLVTYSEEQWNPSSHKKGITYTSRSAFSLGNEASTLLLKLIDTFPSKCSHVLLEDHIVNSAIDFPSPTRKIPFTHTKYDGKEPLRILMADLRTSYCARLLATNFTQKTDIPVQIDILPHSYLLKEISEDSKKYENNYDIYMYDIPWLSYLVQNELIMDIDEYINHPDFPKNDLFSHNLENCKFKERYYGIPFVSGSHLMLYRKDLFDNHKLKKAYSEKYELPLRPPKTWVEFNNVSEFFTKAFQPNSPTQYGTAVAGSGNEELAPEILIRLWAFGGNLWDQYKRATLNTPKNANAFHNLLQTTSFTGTSPFETSILDTVNDFASGKTAMLLTFSEYAADVSKGIYKNIIGNVGYELLPGKTCASIGWNLGINPLTTKYQEALQFFDWLCQKEISHYMTIMGAQPPMKTPYQSPEILKLYPWLEFTEPSFAYCRKRMGPSAEKTLVIPQNKIEQIVCAAFRDIVENGMTVEDSLEKWQVELEQHFKAYGYPKPLHFIEEPNYCHSFFTN